ncbi:hypothetical protein PHMEG_00019192 [Phytophthora megakarya]|uniref:Necrosis inducing protein NPP1 n=1 Tax=Phytophthora megakarya TaxID=4795 RepID=A0A225VRX7_9STRA|nr:hypothetical protein PHMEG_00019192 [Phytophthora megakarya]
MNLPARFIALFAVLLVCAQASIDHDKVEPLPQPEPVTVAEKAAVKFKPQLRTSPKACVSFPAVNAAGEVTGGLKGTNGNDACESAPLGSQIYGRAGWYEDKWAMMFSWYFPKRFARDLPQGRHDWKNVVVWIDNPDFETPKILAVSLSHSRTSYKKERDIYERNFVSNSPTSLRIEYILLHLDPAFLGTGDSDGQYQDLIMWEQLTDPARGALNDANNFGDAEVPFNEGNYEKYLEKAWPF